MQAIQLPNYINNLCEYNILSEDMNAEVFSGRLEPMVIPHPMHLNIVMEISYILHSYVKIINGSCKVYPAPFEVLLNDSPLTVLRPDIMVVCDSNKLDGCRCCGAPDFVIEIVSPHNPSVDYIKKSYYYHHYHVREYWIIDPDRKTITVNYYENDSVCIQYPFSSKIKVNIYDDLYIDFNKLCIA